MANNIEKLFLFFLSIIYRIRHIKVIVLSSFKIDPKSFGHPWSRQTFLPSVSIWRFLVNRNLPQYFFLGHLRLATEAYINADFIQASFVNCQFYCGRFGVPSGGYCGHESIAFPITLGFVCFQDCGLQVQRS